MNKAVRYGILALVAAVMMLPFVWMAITSVSRPEDVLRVPPRLPLIPRFSNYAEVAERVPLGLFFWNSVKISVLGTLGELIAASLAAYAFARMEFRGKKLIYAALLATMMVPFQVTMVPVFLVMRTLGWLDSHASLIVPHFMGGAFATAGFGIFMLRQFFDTIPRELDDAARIDGAGRFRYFLRVVLPLSRPALAVLSIFIFMGIWNDLLSPVLFLSSESLMPLPFGLASLQSAGYSYRQDLLMAGTLISVVPIILLYIAAQKWITEAFLHTGLKG